MFKPLINKNKDNIFSVRMPFDLLKRDNSDGKKMVIFWGADFKFLPPGIPEDKFIELSNACLDYVRTNCSDCELIYKLHPAETDEYTKLNLEGFSVVGTENIAEFYLAKHLGEIKHTFSAISGACVSAHKLGIPSFVFLPIFEPLFKPETKKGYREYFSPLPKASFISDFNAKFENYDINIDTDQVLLNNFKNLLKNNSGKIFFIADTPGLLADILSLVSLVKNISPAHKTGLVVCRHHRWDVMNFEELRKYFDSIDVFPRTFYSLRPNKLIQAIKIARSIKKFPVSSSDILVGLTHTSFPEVCFLSYHKKAKRLCFLSKVSFDTVYGAKGKEMIEQVKYKPKLASKFYNMFFEPILRLYRTVYMDDPGKVMNFRSYQKPVNDIYDQIYLM